MIWLTMFTESDRRYIVGNGARRVISSRGPWHGNCDGTYSTAEPTCKAVVDSARDKATVVERLAFGPNTKH